jgi:hypothetical protein
MINDMKKIMNFALMAAMVCGLALSVASCKDDDDNDSNNNEQQGGDSSEGLYSLEDEQLGALICQWCDVQADEVKDGAWRNKTYEATEGTVVDESKPTVRSIVVGDVAGADSYALRALAALGIDRSAPDGFQFSNAEVGTVKYSHVSDANVVATIDVDVRQIPGLTRMQLLKTLPENARYNARYRVGDIIGKQVKGEYRYYVCVSEHQGGEKAVFITLNDQNLHTMGKFNWRGVGQDTVYNDKMADAETVYLWLKNVAFNEEVIETVREKMLDYDPEGTYINQVVPANEERRYSLLDTLTESYRMVFNCMQTTEESDYIGIRSGGSAIVSSFFWYSFDRELYKIIVAPYGQLLCNKLRWQEFYTGKSWNQWVPYIILMKDKDYEQNAIGLNRIAPLTTLSPSHFKWEDLGEVTVDKDLNRGSNIITKKKYRALLVATYWQHEEIVELDTPHKMLLHYGKDWRQHPDEKVRMQVSSNNHYWEWREITSSQVTFTDKGNKTKDYDEIYVKANYEN